MTKVTENIYPNQYKDLNLFFKKFVGEQLLSSVFLYDMVNRYYPIQTKDFRFQLDQLIPKKH